jgi:tRNA dimethylallyltransferase
VDPVAPLLVLVGPTGVGKTAVAVRLAAELPLEAISADSRQVYRGMDIGTGKPTAAEHAALRHHLIDVVDPDGRYHAAQFRGDALRAIAEVRGRGRLPIVVGGTGLYVRALLKGLHAAPPADVELRRELEGYARAHGSPALHGRLAAVDAEAAARLHPNDRIRIVRALEIRTLASRVAASAGPGAAGATTATADWDRAAVGPGVLTVGLRQARETLNARLAGRARAMVEHGMMEEVERLLTAGYDEALPAMGGIGYRQFAAVVRGRLSADEALRLMIRDTQRYAKRQMTWFARDPEIHWIDVDAVGGLDAAAAQVRALATKEGLIE